MSGSHIWKFNSFIIFKITFNLKLKYPQLVLGDKVEVPTIDGGQIKIHVPEYSKIGDDLKITKTPAVTIVAA